MTDQPTEQDVDAAHRLKVRGYGRLLRWLSPKTRAEGRLADAILAKWLSDEDADQKWGHLLRDVDAGTRRRLWHRHPWGNR